MKVTQKNCCKDVSFSSLQRTQTVMVRSKCSKNYFLVFYHHFSYNWVDLICWTCFVFFKFPWWPLSTYCASDLLKRTILSNIICVILIVKLFSRNSYPWLLLQVNVCDHLFQRAHTISLKVLLRWSFTRK